MTRAALALTARAGSLLSAALLLVSAHATVAEGLPRAAAGREAPLPTLDPVTVLAATDAFSIEPPTGARCEEDGTGSGNDPTPGPRTGADQWRWHGFIIDVGRDPSSLRFTAFGPGQDHDATDGELTAGLLTAQGDGVWQMLPALKPEGHINPDELGGLLLDPSTYTLRDGEYLLGFACTDDTLATRQWWGLTVTVKSDGQPFLTAEDQAGAGDARSSPAGVSVGGDGDDLRALREDASELSPGDRADGAPPTGGGGTSSDPSAVAPDVDPSEATTAELAATGAPVDQVVPAGSATGISWTAPIGFVGAPGPMPIGGWAVLAVVLARIAYLLAIPVRVLPPAMP